MRVLKAVSAAVILSATCSAYATSSSYGMGGCGLGSMAIGAQPGKIQILAVTVNNLISPQTSAITSGTSNCTEGAGSDEAANQYIDVNRETLKADVARGNGETLAALLDIYKCDNTQSASTALQGNYSKIFNSSEVAPAADINSNIKSVIRANEVHCASII